MKNLFAFILLVVVFLPFDLKGQIVRPHSNVVHVPICAELPDGTFLQLQDISVHITGQDSLIYIGRFDRTGNDFVVAPGTIFYDGFCTAQSLINADYELIERCFNGTSFFTVVAIDANGSATFQINYDMTGNPVFIPPGPTTEGFCEACEGEGRWGSQTLTDGQVYTLNMNEVSSVTYTVIEGFARVENSFIDLDGSNAITVDTFPAHFSACKESGDECKYFESGTISFTGLPESVIKIEYLW